MWFNAGDDKMDCHGDIKEEFEQFYQLCETGGIAWQKMSHHPHIWCLIYMVLNKVSGL